MRADTLALVAPGTFEVDQAELPEPGPRQVLVRMAATGVCKSDVDGFRGRAALPERYVGGHEGSGRIAAVGSGITDFAIGDAVALLGDGRFATFVIAEYRDVAHLGEVGDFADRIVEPLACCLNAVELAHVRPADQVGVVGAGYMGQGVIRCLGLTGAARVIAMDVKRAALDLALASGADETIDLTDADPLAVLAGSAPIASETAYVLPGQASGPLDIVFECSGTPSGLALATSLLRVGGTLVMVGFQRGDVALPGEDWHMRGLTVLNTSPMSAPDFRGTFRRTAALLAEGRLDGSGLVTHRATIDDAATVFEAAGGPDYVKGVITL